MQKIVNNIEINSISKKLLKKSTLKSLTAKFLFNNKKISIIKN